MSDVSVLSHEYQTASELSDVLNRSLIVLKKKVLGLPGAAAVSDEELAQSRVALVGVLDALIDLLGIDAVPAHSRRRGGAGAGSVAAAAGAVYRTAPDATLAQVPGAVVGRLRAAHDGEVPYFLEDLQRVAAKLRQPSGTLSPEDLQALEEIAAAAEAEASTVYRRLMRT
jgi:hypothetical protein